MAQSTESSSDVSVSTQWALTQTKLINSSYTWKVDNFSFCIEKPDNYITSPTFTTEGYDDINWDIVLYPMGRISEKSDHVSLYIRLVSSKSNDVKARVQLSILNCLQEETIIVSSPQTIVFNTKPVDGSKSVRCYGKSQCIRRSILRKQRYLLADKLTIRCKVVFMVNRINTNGREGTPQFKIKTHCISDDFGKLFEDMKLSDVTLVAGGKEIRAHKAILAARSVVFAAMFEHDMQEQKLSHVDITDVDYDVLKEMLSFMYTDRPPNLDNMAADLLVAADKYALDSLKVQCEESISKNLSVETAADTLVLANLHSAALLKEHTIAYINSRNAAMVMETEGWKKMTSTHPHLVAELFRAARGD